MAANADADADVLNQLVTANLTEDAAEVLREQNLEALKDLIATVTGDPAVTIDKLSVLARIARNENNVTAFVARLRAADTNAPGANVLDDVDDEDLEGCLVMMVRGATHRVNLRNARELADAGLPSGLGTATSGGQMTRPRAISPELEQELIEKFEAAFGYCLDETLRGDRTALGITEFCYNVERRPPSLAMWDMSKRRSAADGSVPSRSRIAVEDGALTTEVDDPTVKLPEATNAAMIVKQFSLFVYTQLMSAHHIPAYETQDAMGGGTNVNMDERPQMALGDAAAVMAVLHNYEQRVTKLCMVETVTNYWKQVRRLCGVSARTVGAAMMNQLASLETALSTSAGLGPTGGGGGGNGTQRGTPTLEDWKSRAMKAESDAKNPSNAAKVLGVPWGRGGGRGYAQNYGYHPYPPRGGKGNFGPPGGGRGGKGGRGGRGGTNDGGRIGGYDASTGLARLKGGNPHGAPCPDFAANKCKREFCSFSHA